MPESGLFYFSHCYTVRTQDGQYSLAGEEANFRICCVRTARLIEDGWIVYSPIAMTHPIHCAYPDFVGKEVHEMWYRFDNEFIRLANFSGIILAPGWEESKGCCGEKKLFEQMEKKVLYYLEPGIVVDNAQI